MRIILDTDSNEFFDEFMSNIDFADSLVEKNLNKYMDEKTKPNVNEMQLTRLLTSIVLAIKQETI